MKLSCQAFIKIDIAKHLLNVFIFEYNTSYSGKCAKAIKNLINDLKCNAPEKIINKHIAERFKELKSNSAKKEVDYMCELLDKVLKEENAKARAEGISKGRAEGIAEGRSEGIAENSREIARKMLSSEKFTVELIAEFCNLTVEEVNALKTPA